MRLSRKGRDRERGREKETEGGKEGGKEGRRNGGREGGKRVLVSSYSISYFSLRGTGLSSASFTGNSKKIKKKKTSFFLF